MKNPLRSMKLWQKFSAIGLIATVMCAVPLVQLMHGGPHTMVRDSWSYRWNAHAFAAVADALADAGSACNAALMDRQMLQVP